MSNTALEDQVASLRRHYNSLKQTHELLSRLRHPDEETTETLAWLDEQMKIADQSITRLEGQMIDKALADVHSATESIRQATRDLEADCDH